MTETQRAYLADLAINKGVKIDDTADKPVSWASAKIEELKAMPDANLDEVTPEMVEEVDGYINKAIKELYKWNFSQ